MAANVKIGVTERGDAGLDLSWQDKLGSVDGAILITKNLTDRFVNALINAYAAGHKVMLHCGCTGWGGTPIEPNVPAYQDQLNALYRLLRLGFPANLCVLRIDPIFPTAKGLARVGDVIEYANDIGVLDRVKRVRISVYDEYRHAFARFKERGLLTEPLYGGSLFAPKEKMQEVHDRLEALGQLYGICFETCAEPLLQGHQFVQQGCVSLADLEAMGIKKPVSAFTNPQNRHGCLCIGGKVELLNCPHPCAHNCVYCYWKDSSRARRDIRC